MNARALPAYVCNWPGEMTEVLVMRKREKRMRNGRVAWEILQDNHDGIDLVITDLMMPEMDGHELIVKIREDIKTAKKPIIVQSAYLGVKGTRELMEQGADAVIPKPIDGQYLMDHIARHIALNTPEKSKSANLSNQRLA